MLTTVRGEAQLVDRLYGTKQEVEDHYSEYDEEQRSLMNSLYNSQWNSDDEEEMPLKGQGNYLKKTPRSMALCFAAIILILTVICSGLLVFKKQIRHFRDRSNDNKVSVVHAGVPRVLCELSTSHIHCSHNHTKITVQGSTDGRWPEGMYW